MNLRTPSLAIAACLIAISGCSTISSPAKGPGASRTGVNSDEVRVAPPRIPANLTAPQVTERCQAALVAFDAGIDAIANLTLESRSVSNTLLILDDHRAKLSDATLPLTALAYVHPDRAVIDAASQCEQDAATATIRAFSRQDFYSVMQSVNDQVVAASVDAPSLRALYDENLAAFAKLGMSGSPESAARASALLTQIKLLEARYMNRLNQTPAPVFFSETDLRGLPAQALADLPRESDGRVRVISNKPNCTKVLQNADVPATRHQMLLACWNRGGAENVADLEHAVDLRQQAAEVMGRTHWADFRTHFKVAGSAQNVREFFARLQPGLIRTGRADLARLLTAKRELDPAATELNAWDIEYFSQRLLKRDYAVDEEQIRPYFPAPRVIAGIFSVYSRILGVEFRKVTDLTDEQKWDPTVDLYAVYNPGGTTPLAYFYMDLFSRTAPKYGHAAMFPLVGGRRLSATQYQAPLAMIVANFNPPTADRPGLLSHSEVKTFFHEFGHVMHETLTSAPYYALSGTKVEPDFVEAPSQMLENWVWSPEVLAEISGHYLRPTEQLPTAMLERMLAAKDFNRGYNALRQLMLATFDLDLHSRGTGSSTELSDRLYTEFFGIPALAGGHYAAGFQHLMGDYDAGYYGYLWSEVYAEDLFTRFADSGLFSPTVGADYRRLILEAGVMTPSLDRVAAFLGRAPSITAFLRKLGISDQ